jgi:hypothetical protein
VLLGVPLLDWQRELVDVALELDPSTGRLAFDRVVALLPRRAGKTLVSQLVGIHRAITTVDGRIWHTAQTRQDSRDRWSEVARLVQRSPIGRLVTVRLAAGSEALVFPNGASVRVFSPLPNSLHGSSSDMVTIDEAWAFDAGRGRELLLGIRPTMATRPSSQLWIVSTAGNADSTFLRELVELGRASSESPRSSTCYFEWSAPDDADPQNPAVWHAAHPALGSLVEESFLASECETMPESDFRRSYLNQWAAFSDAAIPPSSWAACRSPLVMPGRGELALGFDVAPGRECGSIAASWIDAHDRPCVELVDHRPGTGWIVERLTELVYRWEPPAIAFEARGPAASIADHAARLGLEVTAVASGEYPAACTALLDAILNRQLRHRGDDALDSAVAAAVRRLRGESWVWARHSTAAPVCPLVAATLAAWSWTHRPEEIEMPAIF